MLKRLLIVALVLLAGLAGGLWWWARQSLPPLDGEQSVPGLAAPVEVLVDGHGVPHVYAAGPEDAWFAAGVLHARDRLWQMELYRRATMGRLSEVLGRDALPLDRRLLTLDLRAAARQEWAAAPPAARQALTRYAAGVNAQLARATGRRRPLEFQLLNLTPVEWTPLDSLAVGRLLTWRLAENHQAELVRHALATRFGVTEALRLGGRYPPDAPAVVQGLGAIEAHGPGQDLPTPSGDHRALATTARAVEHVWPAGLAWLAPSAPRGGSNNWVIAGRRTASGHPLLANDPHLQIELPGVWYEMHLVAAGLDVIGVGIPGAPFVVLGHNDRIAWGMTNSNADVQDLTVERFDLARRRVFSRGQWTPIEVTRADIPVRGGGVEPFEIWRTPHGTVFAEVGLDWEDAPAWLSPTSARQGERRAFTLRWDAAGETAAAFELLNRAGTWGDFTAAIERFAAPSQNVVYADVDGNIGYALSGALPQRAGGVGSMPSDEIVSNNRWVGQVPPSMLPRLFNPPRGYITSSNNQIDRDWPGFVTRDWAAPYRTLRLHRLLAQGERVDLPQAASWQTDVAGMAAAAVLSYVDTALAAAKGDPDAADVLAQLRAWDRQVDDRPIVTLYHLFEDALWRRTFYDEMGDPLFDVFYQWAGAERPAGLYAILDDPRSRWFDDIATIGRRESRDDIYALAASDAARRYRYDLGRDTPWGEVHGALFAHPLGNAGPPLRWLFNRGPVPVIGDTFTVNRASYHRLRPFGVWETSSWRQLFDVGRWDEAHVVLPTGQSGHPLSPHYFDQNEMWRTGQYRRQPFSRAAVEAAHEHRMVWVP